jgi:hypothetical protein
MQIWPILAQWFWRFLNDPHPILQLSPLWRGHGPLFEQFRISFSQGWFMPSLIEIGQLIWRRFLNIFSVFLLFCDYLPMEKGNPLHLNNLAQVS